MRENKRIPRCERIRNAQIHNGIIDVPINHRDPKIIAYGRAPFPLKASSQDNKARRFLYLKVKAWLNGPAMTETRLDRLMRDATLPMIGNALVFAILYFIFLSLTSAR